MIEFLVGKIEPYSTAPRDGTPFLLFRREADRWQTFVVRALVYYPNPTGFETWGCIAASYNPGEWLFNTRLLHIGPGHKLAWLPLPAPHPLVTGPR